MDMGEMFGWVRTLLEELGVWSMLGVGLQIMLVVTATTYAVKIFRGGA